MKKRIIAIIALFALALVALSACAEQNYDFAGKTYIYEKLLGDEPFVIEIKDDGTYTYLEGSKDLIVHGKWSYKKGTITLRDDDSDINHNTLDNTTVNKFVVEDGYLAFIEEESTNFKYLKIANGDKFYDISASKAE